MDASEFAAASDSPLWPEMLQGVEADLPEAVDLAYFETTAADDDAKVYKAVALLVVGKCLRFYSLISEGSAQDAANETVSRRDVPLGMITFVESKLHRDGWGRHVGEGGPVDRAYSATIHPLYGPVFTIPVSEHGHAGARRARPFVDALVGRLS